MGDAVVVSRKPTGTLVLRDLKPGKNLYLLATGTGLAPFISLIQDPESYERFDKVILVHGVRTVNELAYRDFITEELPKHEYFADLVQDKLIYYPTVTREPFQNQGRITHLIENGKLFSDIGLPTLNPLLNERGFKMSPHIGATGDYVIERAFVEK